MMTENDRRGFDSSIAPTWTQLEHKEGIYTRIHSAGWEQQYNIVNVVVVE